MPRLPYSKKKAIAHLSTDDHLRRALDRVGPFRLTIGEMEAPFDALLRSIVFQSVSTQAATTIHGRVIDTIRGRNGDKPVTPETVSRCRRDRLRKAGLSWAKVDAMKDLARLTKAGVVPGRDELSDLTDDEIVERLTAVRGIGRWTVEMLLIFSLGRPDVLPATDLGIRKGFATVYGYDELPAPREILAYGDRWRPYRSVASWYLWRVTDLPDLDLS